METFFYLSIFLNVREVRVTWNVIKVIEEGVLAFLGVEISYGYSDFQVIHGITQVQFTLDRVSVCVPLVMAFPQILRNVTFQKENE